MRGNVVNKNNSPVNIRFVAKTSDIRNFSENIRSDVKTSEVATLVLRRWREVTNISASMKTFHCYDIDHSVVLIRHHWLDRQDALWKIAVKMCGLRQDFVTWKICQEASADMRGRQITFKPNCFKKTFGKHKDRFGFERTAETKYQRSQCWGNLHVSLKLSATAHHTDRQHSRLDQCMHCKRLHKL